MKALNDIHNAILTTNTSGIITSSENIKKITGFESSQVNGKIFYDLLVSPFKEHYNALISSFQICPERTENALFRSNHVEMQHKTSGTTQVTLTIFKQKGDSILMIFLEKGHESASAVIISISTDGIILSSNQAESIFGYSHHELIGKPLSHLLPYFDLNLNRTISEQPHFANVLAKHQKGTFFWLSLQKCIIKVGTFELTTLQLQKVDSSMEALFTTDKNGNIQNCSSISIHHLFGYRSQELLGCNLTCFITKKISIFQTLTSCHTPLDQNDEEEGKEDDDVRSPSKCKRRKSITNSSPHSDSNVERFTDCTRAPIRTHFQHKDGSLVSILFQVFPFSKENEIFFSVRVVRIGLEDEMQARIDEYALLETIGRGCSGKVKRAIHRTTGEQVAIKVIDKRKLSPTHIERSQREAQIMKGLNHKNIVKLYHVIDTPEKLFLVMEFIQGTDLMQYVQEKKSLSEAEAKEIFVQLISALNHCHNRSVVHRDVKLRNILIEGEAKTVKLIDFGLSNWSKEDVLQTTYCGTPAFAAPEIILAKQYEGRLVDVWSAGVVLYFILTLQFPFVHVGELLDGTYKDPPNVSKDCCDVIRRMLVVDPSKRATFQQVVEHPWCQFTI